MSKSEGGFTVLEIVIAIGLIGIVIPAMYLTSNSIVRINKSSRNIALANIAAENKIESLRSNGYNAINNGQTDFTSEVPKDLPKPNSAVMNVTTSIGKKYIDLSISFKDSNRQRTVLYKTIVSETGVGQ